MTPVMAHAQGALVRPLYVDLDGTLLRTDTLWEAIIKLLHRSPAASCLLPFWLLGGKARFKRKIAERAPLNPRLLPYNEEVLAFVQSEQQRGRSIYLATAADRLIAEPIAQHLGLFAGVLASDGEANLSKARKLRAIQEHSGHAPFDYIGNSSHDFAIWKAATSIFVVSSSAGLLRRVQKQHSVERFFPGSRPGALPLLRALRPHQWIKNMLLFVPLLMAHLWNQADKIEKCGLAFFCFSMCASAGYLFNDLFDLEADRAHPLKRNRPLASGALSIPVALAALVGCSCLGLGVAALWLPPLFLGSLVLYVVMTLAYSLILKQKLLADILVLAGLYALRLLAGGLAVDVKISRWMLAFSMFMFLSLAFAKRGAELILLKGTDSPHARRRAYRLEDLDLVHSMGPSSGYLAVLVLCLYINSEEVTRLYKNVDALWLICPVLLYWISRFWFIVGRGHLPGDPVLFAVKDPISLVAGLIVVIIVFISSL